MNTFNRGSSALSEQLSDKEMEQLDTFLIERISEQGIVDIEASDEGVFNISALDGFFTAIASGPCVVPPSEWLQVS